MDNQIIEKYIQFAIDNWWENAIMSDLKIKKQIKPSHKFLKRRLDITISYLWDDDITKEFIIKSDNLKEIHLYIASEQLVKKDLTVSGWKFQWHRAGHGAGCGLVLVFVCVAF